MTSDTKKQIASATALTGLVGAVLFSGVKLSQLVVDNAAKPRTVTLQWDTVETDPATITEVWASTNLTIWTLRTNVAGTNRVTLPATNAAEYFKIRNRLGDQVSDWARKP